MSWGVPLNNQRPDDCYVSVKGDRLQVGVAEGLRHARNGGSVVDGVTGVCMPESVARRRRIDACMLGETQRNGPAYHVEAALNSAHSGCFCYALAAQGRRWCASPSQQIGREQSHDSRTQSFENCPPGGIYLIGLYPGDDRLDLFGPWALHARIDRGDDLLPTG
jgi:hypothetical protein